MEHPAQDPARPAPVPDRVRRRLDEVFGDVLPEVTRDEIDPDPTAGAGPDGSSQPGSPGDEWLRVNRPPHHEDRG